MRSQQEIIQKIQKIRASKTDPMGVQVKMLTRKLHWATARELLPRDKALDPAIEQKWEVTACLDKKFLIGEISELMYQAYEGVIDFNLRKCLMFLQIFMVYGWLMHDDLIIKELMMKMDYGYKIPMQAKKYFFKGVFDLVCDNFSSWPGYIAGTGSWMSRRPREGTMLKKIYDILFLKFWFISFQFRRGDASGFGNICIKTYGWHFHKSIFEEMIKVDVAADNVCILFYKRATAHDWNAGLDFDLSKIK